MDNKLTVRVFVPTTFEGVTSVAILEDIIHPNVHLDVRYTRHLDFREHWEFHGADIVLILGLAYKGYTLPEEFYTEVDVPFMDFHHGSTYGKPIEGRHIQSIVTEDADPIYELCHHMRSFPDQSLLSKNVTITDKAWQMINAVNSYRTWTWEGNDIVRLLLALYHASYTLMPGAIRGNSLEETVKKNAIVIKGQMEKLKAYIARKKEVTQTYTVDINGTHCLLKVVFADEYINELANELLNDEKTSMPVIVCVGRATKSNDMFSIRTKRIHAGQVANLVNEGNGKEEVGTVFVDVGYAELMGKSIIAALTRNVQ